VSEPRKTQCD